MTRRAAARGRRLGMPAWRSRPEHGPRPHGPGQARPIIRRWLAAAFLAGAPLAAFAAWQWAHTGGLHAERAQQAARHQVPAVVLQAASGPAGSPAGTRGTGYAGPETAYVRARWTAPGGTWRTGVIPVRTGTRAGRTVPVWTDASGRLTGPPVTGEQVTGQAVVAAITAPALLAVALMGAGGLASHPRTRRHGEEDRDRTQAVDAPAAANAPHRAPGGLARMSVRRSASARRAGRTGPGGQQRPVPASYAARWRAALRSADRAGCCPARPSVIAVMPPAATRPHPTELLLCRHHYRAHRMALWAADAAIYEPDAVTPVIDVPQPRGRHDRPRAAPAGTAAF